MSLCRAAIIGCGKIGSENSFQTDREGIHSYGAGFTAHPNVELVGVCDLQIEAARKAADHWKTSAWTDFLEMMEKTKPDLVVICTPDETHYSLAMKLIQNPSHRPRLLIVEKPLAMKSNHAEEILQAAAEENILVLLNLSRRYWTAFQKVAEGWKKGDFGDFRVGTLRYTRGIRHNGSHALDLVWWWFGAPDRMVGRLVLSDYPGDETLDLDLEWKSGARLHLQGVDGREMAVFEGDFIGSKARVRFERNGDAWNFQTLQKGPYPGFSQFYDANLFSDNTCFEGKSGMALKNLIDQAVTLLERGGETNSCAKDSKEILQRIEVL